MWTLFKPGEKHSVLPFQTGFSPCLNPEYADKDAAKRKQRFLFQYKTVLAALKIQLLSVSFLSIFYNLQKIMLHSNCHISPQMKRQAKQSSDAFPMTSFRSFVLRFVFTERVSSDKFGLTFFQAAYLL